MTKTVDLTEAALDYWVARACGMTAGMMTVSALRAELERDRRDFTNELAQHTLSGKDGEFAQAKLSMVARQLSALDGVECDGELRAVRNGEIFEPSSNWAQGGPLFDYFNVTFELGPYHPTARQIAAYAHSGKTFPRYGVVGPFPRLKAACLAIVGCVYGHSVPDEVRP